MKWNQLLRKEFTQIIKSKKILIPIIAVLFVPILYAGMFLWAFWDPYKQLDDLPVAVVNLDKGAVFDGKPIEVGKGLVDNLKDNTSFKWEFVSEKEAKKGMEGRKYYMLVRIPDNFSSNATTLLKDDPKPLNLEYIPNESLNFLSSQIGGTAIEKIKGEVSSTLTKTYAEKMFDSIQDVSKGLADGAEGANKLHDGSSELHDGSSKVTDGLHTLQGKSGEMKDGVGELLVGSNKLLNGSGQVSSGLNLLNSKTGDLKNGVGQLVNGSGQVSSGLNLLNSKTGDLKNGVGQLVDGSGQVSSGLNLLNSKTGDLKNGVGQLLDGSGQVSSGLNLLNSKTEDLKDGVGQLLDGSGKLTKGLKDLSSKSTEFKKGTSDLATGMNGLSTAQSELEKGAKGIQEGIHEINGNVKSSISNLENMGPKLAEINKASKEIEGLNQISQSNVNSSNEAMNNIEALKTAIQSLPKEEQDKLNPLIQRATDSMKIVQKKSSTLAVGTNELSKKVSGLQVQLPNTDQINTLTARMRLLENKQNEFVAQFQVFGNKLSVATKGGNDLSKNSNVLVDGVNKLADGSNEVTTGLGQLSTKSNEMIGGINKLAGGSNQVTNGLGQLSTKSNEMIGGINKLADGSNQVTNGLGQLSTKSNEMIGGINKLADGSTQVTTGLGTLNGGLNTMSTGSTQLIDGVNKLADGSGKVTDGLVKVNDGSGELAEKLGEGAEKTGEVKGTDKTYDMFASPVKVKTEKMAEVPNYGTGFTPYFLSLGLFVGALLLSIVYPLRDTVGVPKSGFSWFISKFGVLLSVGIIQAVVADVILLFGLGVEVQSIPYFILFSIVTSLAFIALIQCLVTAFGDAGRFIAIITLIIQLTTSAGTFPLELIPKLLQPFNAWLPMTYSVSGLKAVVSSGDFNFMWQNIGILMIFIVVLSLGTIASLTWMHKRQFKNIAENQSIEA
ncbi:YhgE/Pip domain-containing protein [Bacillus cereus]|uniref:YhgE/Pip domain-containing protein n=2 Tax=Bacillus cereus TaxID=1396 RepID=UPI000D948782|nr:YhgE/Pip domain-containing protein [Bacillus cereus]PYD99854.1 phage infection protein [Bacillus cereus]